MRIFTLDLEGECAYSPGWTNRVLIKLIRRRGCECGSYRLMRSMLSLGLALSWPRRRVSGPRRSGPGIGRKDRLEVAAYTETAEGSLPGCAGGVKREPGVNPGLPRSGERERPPS